MNCVQLPPFYRGESFDVRAAGLPYHLADQNMPRHWVQTDAGNGVLIAILDTGIESSHPEFAPGQIIGGKSFVGRRWGKSWEDKNDHGTRVAGIVGGQSVGMAPRCKLLPVKVLGDNGAGSNQGVAEGVDYAREQKVDLICMSLGGPVDDRQTREAILRAKAAGIIVIIATGNEGASFVGYPAQHGIGVGAVDQGHKLAYFSNRGKKVDLVGHGVKMYSAVLGGRYGEGDGTSFAAPEVVGITANRQSAEIKYLGSIQTRTDADLLSMSTFTTDLGPEGRDTSYGLGMVDLEKAFYERLEIVPVFKPIYPPAQPPCGEPTGTFMARIESVGSGNTWLGVLNPEKVTP